MPPPLVRDDQWYEEFLVSEPGNCIPNPYYSHDAPHEDVICYRQLQNFGVFSCLINDPEKGLGPFVGQKSGNWWGATATVTTKFLASAQDNLKFVNLMMVNKELAKETNLTEGDWVFTQGGINLWDAGKWKNYFLYLSHPPMSDNSFPLSEWKLQLVEILDYTHFTGWGPISFTAIVDFQLCNSTCPPITDCGSCINYPKPPSPSPPSLSKGLSTPAIIGISIGAVVLVIAIILFYNVITKVLN